MFCHLFAAMKDTGAPCARQKELLCQLRKLTLKRPSPCLARKRKKRDLELFQGENYFQGLNECFSWVHNFSR